jgi:hypothetical protein
MGLYLCVFDGDDDVAGVDVGAYSDFDHFRETIANALESRRPGSRFPTLMLHSDCDGEWSVDECNKLVQELNQLSRDAAQLSPVPFRDNWQSSVADREGLRPKSLLESFIDVDGECLVERLAGLCSIAIERGLPITFQ